MESWTEISDRLLSRYVAGTAWTLDRLSVLLDRLAGRPGRRQARQALDDLRRCFRGIARSAGGYGLAALAAAGGEGERDCDALLRDGSLPASSQLEAWRALVRGMCAEIAGAARPERPAPTAARLAPQVGRGCRPAGHSPQAGRGDRLQELSTHDGRGQLLTHEALMERARELTERQRDDPRRQATWVMIGLDRFESIDDRFGHPVGDRVLTAVAAHLGGSLRAGDSVGRCGGEELALLLDGSSEIEACALTERLREELSQLEHDVGGGVGRVTFSAGIAMLRPGMSLEQWRSTADLALYAAKEGGRDCVAVARLEPAPPGDAVAAAEAAAIVN